MSDELMKDKEIVKLEKTLVNNRYQAEFVQEVRNMDKQQLDAKLLDLAKYAQAVDSTRKSDQKLKDAKDVVKGLNKPYTDDIKYNREKARFVALIMEDKFGDEQ